MKAQFWYTSNSVAPYSCILENKASCRCRDYTLHYHTLQLNQSLTSTVKFYHSSFKATYLICSYYFNIFKPTMSQKIVSFQHHCNTDPK